MKQLFKLLLMLLVSIGSFSQKNKQNTGVETDDQKQERLDTESLLAEGMKQFAMEEYARADTILRKALKKNPNEAAINYALAKVLAKEKQIDEATIYSQKAYENTPQNKFYLIQLAELYIRQTKYNKAADLYESLLKQNPIENAEFGIDLASAYLLDDKYEEALKAYENVEKSLGIDEDIVRQKQRIYLTLKKPEKALSEADRLMASDPTETRYMVDKAKLLLLLDKKEEAESLLKHIVDIDPDANEGRLLLADSYKLKGDTQGSAKEMNTFFDNANGDVDLKIRELAMMLREAKDPAAKQELLQKTQKLTQIHPKDHRVFAIYGDLLEKNEQKNEARAAYLKAASLNNSVSQLWLAILELDSRLEQPDSLIKHADQAIEVFPNDGIFWFWSGTGHFLKRNHAKAVESLEEARKLTSPENAKLSGIILGQLGDAYHSTAQHEQSDEAYEAALKIDPNNDYVLNNYSYYLSLRKQKLDLAKQMAAKVVEQNPTNSTYLDTYAWVLYANKDYKEARIYLEKAITANTKVSATIVEHYGDVLFRLGEKEQAVEQWQKAKNMGGKGADLDKKITTKEM